MLPLLPKLFFLRGRSFVSQLLFLCLGILTLGTGLHGTAFFAYATDTTLVPATATWRYLDNGTDQGSVWRAPSFNDSTWAAGPAELGYGDGDEATIVKYGPSWGNKNITTYFRHAFIVPDPSIYVSLRLRLQRDDGAVVYLNGTEVRRDIMPAGLISYTHDASILCAW